MKEQGGRLRQKVALLFVSMLLVSLASASGAPQAGSPGYSCDCLGHPLVQEAEDIFSRMTNSSYQNGMPVMNDMTGVYLCDCSGYLNYILKNARPDAYSEVPDSTRRPTTEDYYNLFSRMRTSPSPASAWYRVRDVRQLCPGDVVVWRKPDGAGHVCLVMEQARINPERTNEVLVRVVDSALSGHADDTREAGTTGIGSGVIGLKIDNKGSASGVYWRGGVSKTVTSASFAVGRLS